ncbi:SDR family NAD(P)-dependent oxidoreductase [Saccharopolyspora spinosporotrichia]
MQDRLSQRVALVTGASGGIGAAISHRLAAEGATVVVTDVDQDACDRLTADLADAGARAVGMRLDVTDESAWQQVVTSVLEDLGALAVLVNNAGIGEATTVESETAETWDQVTAVTQGACGSA